MPKYMKNITLFLILFASITLQAQKVHLDSVQTKLFAINGYRGGSYTTKQYYDSSKRKLIKEYSLMIRKPYVTKSIYFYDKQNQLVLYEEYTRNKDSNKWKKVKKEEYVNDKDKKITSSYNAFRNEWIKERKEELIKKGKFFFYTKYECTEGSKWQPKTQSIYLQNKQNKTTELTHYSRDENKNQWLPQKRIITVYENDTIKKSELKSTYKTDKWVEEAKYEYAEDTIVGAYSIYSEMLNGKWIPKEKNSTKLTLNPTKISRLRQKWNEKQQQWENDYLLEEKYNENDCLQAYIHSNWDKEKDVFAMIEQQSYQYDTHKNMTEKLSIFNEVKKDKIKTVNQYDAQNNRILTIDYRYNFDTDNWEEENKIIYEYNTSILRKSIVDEGALGTVGFDTTHALFSATFYGKRQGEYQKQYELHFYYSEIKKIKYSTQYFAIL